MDELGQSQVSVGLNDIECLILLINLCSELLFDNATVCYGLAQSEGFWGGSRVSIRRYDYLISRRTSSN